MHNIKIYKFGLAESFTLQFANSRPEQSRAKKDCGTFSYIFYHKEGLNIIYVCGQNLTDVMNKIYICLLFRDKLPYNQRGGDKYKINSLQLLVEN